MSYDSRFLTLYGGGLPPVFGGEYLGLPVPDFNAYFLFKVLIKRWCVYLAALGFTGNGSVAAKSPDSFS